MRLFIAIEFSDEIKNDILNSSLIIKNNSFGGNFSNIDNYHLTLAFLGEVKENKVNTIIKIIDSIKIKAFDINIMGFNKFNRDGKSICFREIEINDNLKYINNELVKRLNINGFDIDDREFKAHITLSRETRLKSNFDISKIKIDNIKYNVNNISLMKSERIDGKLVYTCIYNRSL